MRIIFTTILSLFAFTFIEAQVNCIDTIYYPHSKMTSFDPLALMDPTGAPGVSQTYEANTGLIHGIRAFVTLDTNGIPGDTPPLVMQISVMNVDGVNRPTTVIASDLVAVTDVGNMEQNLMFTAPVAVSGRYAVVLELDPASPTTDTAYYMANNQIAGDGNGEGLMSVVFAGSWFNFWFQFGVYDADALLAPIFEKTITAGYTTDTNSVCLGGSIVFTDTSIIDANYMYNLYDSLGTDIYQWNYDDGTGTYNHVDTTYTYATAGTYTTQLLITNYGYTANCVDSVQQVVVVSDTAAANFGYSHMGGGNYQFTDSSIAATSWSWDFGDGSPLDVTTNPTHIYATPGNYQVCLTIDSNGCRVNVFCDSVTFAVGINDYNAPDYVKVYPIPANKHFNVTVPNNYFGGEVIITDVVGQQLKSLIIEKEKIKISTEGIASGIYFVSIDYEGERVFTRRIVIDK